MRQPLDASMLISRALIAWLLMAYALVVYVGVIALGTLPFGDPRADFSPPWWLSALALAMIVPTLPPVYRWVRAGVRDLVFGQHDNPFPVLAQLSSYLDSNPQPQAILPAIAETIAQSLRLPFVEIAPTPDDESSQSATFGCPPDGAEIMRLPLLYGGAIIGEMHVSARRWDEPLSASDLAVLRNLGRQVGISLYAARLTGELQRAREQLVLAREEERRRIRNDLHDGLAPTLASLQMQLGAARSLIRDDPGQAEAVVVDLREALRRATAEIRVLVHGLRPPMLDDLGLVGALRSVKLAGTGLNLEVAAPEPMPPLPAAVEVAVYRIASEAIHNVIKHARASECRVAIELAPHGLELTVADNGRGLPPGHEAGVGLRSMKERAAELGGTLTVRSCDNGGVCLAARLPLAGSAEVTPHDG